MANDDNQVTRDAADDGAPGAVDGAEVSARPRDARRAIALGAIAVVFAAAVAVRVFSGAPGAAPAGTEAVDAVAVYEQALQGDKPVYVLFHSLTCEPCIEIDAVADEVVPGYSDRVTFVDVISDSPSGQLLASRFAFQYIPTSFFVLPDGTVHDSYTGVLGAPDMTARLDALIEAAK